MSTTLHIRVASKLFFADNYRDVASMVVERLDIDDDSIDFIFAYDCELEEKIEFRKKYYQLLILEAEKRLKDA